MHSWVALHYLIALAHVQIHTTKAVLAPDMLPGKVAALCGTAHMQRTGVHSEIRPTGMHRGEHTACSGV